MLKFLISIRNGFSRLISGCFKETSWQPDVSSWDMRILRDWVNNHYIWKQDLAYGLLDNIYSIRHMNWQLKKHGHIKGDCDDLATYTIYLALRIFGYNHSCRVNVISQKHVICLFYADGLWYWNSNSTISDSGFAHIEEALGNYLEPEKERYVWEFLTLEDLYGQV